MDVEKSWQRILYEGKQLYIQNTLAEDKCPASNMSFSETEVTMRVFLSVIHFYL